MTVYKFISDCLDTIDRLLTTLAHLYNLVGWLKMSNPLSL
jgi:hypothetical protein